MNFLSPTSQGAQEMDTQAMTQQMEKIFEYVLVQI
jgi:hypothetical protein